MGCTWMRPWSRNAYDTISDKKMQKITQDLVESQNSTQMAQVEIKEFMDKINKLMHESSQRVGMIEKVLFESLNTLTKLGKEGNSNTSTGNSVRLKATMLIHKKNAEQDLHRRLSKSLYMLQHKERLVMHTELEQIDTQASVIINNHLMKSSIDQEKMNKIKERFAKYDRDMLLNESVTLHEEEIDKRINVGNTNGLSAEEELAQLLQQHDNKTQVSAPPRSYNFNVEDEQRQQQFSESLLANVVHPDSIGIEILDSIPVPVDFA